MKLKIILTILIWFLLGLISFADQTGKNSMFVKKLERLNTLTPAFKKKMVELLEWASGEFPHSEMTVACGYRSLEQQDRLYAKGKHVTNARGGQSKHNFGMACDVYFLKHGKIVAYDIKYQKLGEKAKALGITWGGDFTIPKGDYGHFEM